MTTTSQSYPARIESTLFELTLLKEKIHTRQEQLTEINDLLLLQVLSEVYEDGKKKHANDEQPGLALRTLQRSHEHYQKLKAEIEELTYDRERLLARVERLRNEFKVQLADRLYLGATLDSVEDLKV